MLRVSSPGTSIELTSGISPCLDSRPYVGFNPTSPQNEAGFLVEPPVSEPNALYTFITYNYTLQEWVKTGLIHDFVVVIRSVKLATFHKNRHFREIHVFLSISMHLVSLVKIFLPPCFYTVFLYSFYSFSAYSFSALVLLIGRQEENLVVGCWHCYLSGARWRLAYCPADAITLIVSFFNKIQIGFTFLVPAHPGSPEKGR